MWYTQGFNPHAKMTFGLPLSVGAESLCEYLDLRIDRDMSCEEIKERLNAALTDELYALAVYAVPEKSVFADIIWARYDIRIDAPEATDALVEEVRAYLTTSPLLMDKKSKSGIRQVDITTLIRSLDVRALDGRLALDAVLCVSGSDYLNPEYLIRALRERFSFVPEDDMTQEYSILRTHVYLADGITEFQ
jgi:radical SAM-linked protein